MNKPIDDFDDLPEMTDEIMNEFTVMKPVDLHLGTAEVKSVSLWVKDPNWWVKENITKFGLEMFALDIIIVLMLCWFVWLMIGSWIYFFS